MRHHSKQVCESCNILWKIKYPLAYKLFDLQRTRTTIFIEN